MQPPENAALPFEAAEKIILRWDSTASEEAREKVTFEGDRQEIDRCLQAVGEIKLSMSSASISDDHNKVNSAIQIAMARLEDEFRNILITHTNPIEVDSLSDPSSSASERTEPDEEADGEGEEEDSSVTKGDELLRYNRGASSNNASYRSTNTIREIDLMHRGAVYHLRNIAERMILSGYLRQSIQVYGSVRISAIDASFRRLGIGKLSIVDIQSLEWDQLEAKIREWIRAAKFCIRTLFASEKKLCEQIFDGLGTAIDDACFMETVKGPAIQLFNFAEAIIISRRSPEKLFKILDLHDALMDLIPDIDIVFDSKFSKSIGIQAAEILSRLAEAARGMLSEFENAMLREPSGVPMPSGTVHPLTRYVMNYISLISDYKQTLNELIVSKPSMGSRYSGDPSTPDMYFAELEGKTPLAVHLIWMIVILQFNLDGKFRLYRDASLSHLFMMNNVHYIVQKVKGSSELREMIGDDYLKKATRKFQQAAINYQRATWARVLYCLSDKGLDMSGRFSSVVMRVLYCLLNKRLYVSVGFVSRSKRALMGRFKAFNALFEEVHTTQATWLIPDSQLREELCVSISELLIPAYRTFVRRHGSHLKNYIKYSVQDVENAVWDFFEGIPVSQHLRRSQ